LSTGGEDAGLKILLMVARVAVIVALLVFLAILATDVLLELLQ